MIKRFIHKMMGYDEHRYNMPSRYTYEVIRNIYNDVGLDEGYDELSSRAGSQAVFLSDKIIEADTLIKRADVAMIFILGSMALGSVSSIFIQSLQHPYVGICMIGAFALSMALILLKNSLISFQHELRAKSSYYDALLVDLRSIYHSFTNNPNNLWDTKEPPKKLEHFSNDLFRME